MSERMLPYFAYGSNMDPAQMLARCPSAIALGPAEFRDHELAFPRFSAVRQCAVAGCLPAPGKSVWGVVYRVSEVDFAHLDIFEGFRPERQPAHNSYNRAEVSVLLAGAPLTCMTYEANPSPDPGATGHHYLGQLIVGARHHGLPADYIAMLMAIEVLEGDVA